MDAFVSTFSCQLLGNQVPDSLFTQTFDLATAECVKSLCTRAAVTRTETEQTIGDS